MKPTVLAMIATLLIAAPLRADHEHIPGLDPNGMCIGDGSGDATVLINELILAVNNALGGCPLRPIELQFRGVVGDDDFACGQIYDGIGIGPSQFIPADFRFYVSDVQLVTPAGDEVPVTLEQDGVWQYQNVAMIDLENGSGPCANGNEATNAVVRGTAPAGVYTGVKFTLGLPFELNHGNASTAPSPLNFTAMFWNWQFGYKSIRVDTADDKFRIHVGSTGCDGTSPSRPPTSCEHPNRATVELNGFDPDRSVIVADLKTLLAGNNLDVNDPETPPGCMSDPEDDDCAPLFANLGLTFPGGMPDHHQQFFRVGAPEAHAAHSILDIGSNADGGGALVAIPDFTNPWPLPFSECIGGSDDECTGGVRLYTDTNPGFGLLDADDPEHPAFVLDEGVAVTLVVVDIADELSIKVGETVLDDPGETLLLGQAPEIHVHPEYLLALPAGVEPSATYDVTFRVTTTSPAYTQSELIEVQLEPTGGDDHHHEDGGGNDHH
jgi:uncharacterized repeat protein (TIGR04052 family)